MSICLRLSWHFKQEKSIFLESIFFAKQELVTWARLHVQDFATGKNFSFNHFHNKEKSNKSNKKFFSCILHTNSRGVGKILDSYANPWLHLGVCITVSNSPNPSRVYIRLCKQWKRFLLLKCFLLYHRLIMRVSLLRELLKLHPWNQSNVDKYKVICTLS